MKSDTHDQPPALLNQEYQIVRWFRYPTVTAVPQLFSRTQHPRRKHQLRHYRLLPPPMLSFRKQPFQLNTQQFLTCEKAAAVAKKERVSATFIVYLTLISIDSM